MSSFWGYDITCGGVTSHGVYDVILGVCDVILGVLRHMGVVTSHGVCDVILVVRRLLEVVTSRRVCDVIFGGMTSHVVV